MKNILFIVDSINHGGAGRVVSILANNFDKKKYNVHILLLDSSQDNNSYSTEKHVSVHYLNIDLKKNRDFKTIKYIRKVFIKYRINVCFAFLTIYAEYAVVASFFLKTKIVACERNDPNNSPVGKIYRKLRIPLYKMAKIIVCQTQDMVNFFPKRIAKKGVVILNPVNPDLPPPYVGTRDNKIVSVGKLSKQKNYPVALKAFKIFHDAHPNFIYEIYGEGEERKTIEHIIEELKISDYVFLKGNIVNPFNQINNAKVFLMTSNYEGLSNALIEAMALGIPCVCTDHPIGGAKMLIRNSKNGVLIETGNIEQAAYALSDLVDNDDKSKELSRNAINIRKELSTGSIVEQWEALVERLTKK